MSWEKNIADMKIEGGVVMVSSPELFSSEYGYPEEESNIFEPNIQLFISNNDDQETHSLSSPGGPIRSSSALKICGVCGDIAQSYNFGGLACPSCKVFFRRSIRKNHHLNFAERERHTPCNLEINRFTRKCCPKCRLEKCLAIGMDPTLVLSEDDWQKKRRKWKGKSKDGDGTTNNVSNIPSILDIPNSDPKRIQDVCNFYEVALGRIPHTVPKKFVGQRPKWQILFVWAETFRRYSFFSKLVPEFGYLDKGDQEALLKYNAAPMAMLQGAFEFDYNKNQWPRAGVKKYEHIPEIKMEDLDNLFPPHYLESQRAFNRTFQSMGTDETIVRLLQMFLLFSLGMKKGSGKIQGIHHIEKAQGRYADLLKMYLEWKYGDVEASEMFLRLVSEMLNLRTLAENLGTGANDVMDLTKLNTPLNSRSMQQLRPSVIKFQPKI